MITKSTTEDRMKVDKILVPLDGSLFAVVRTDGEATLILLRPAEEMANV